MSVKEPRRKDIVDIVEALVREFLRGSPDCEQAYEAFEEAHPRRPTSITQRTALCRALDIESHWTVLRSRHPQSSVLDAFVYSQLELVKRRKKEDMSQGVDKSLADPSEASTQWTIKTARDLSIQKDSPSSMQSETLSPSGQMHYACPSQWQRTSVRPGSNSEAKAKHTSTVSSCHGIQHSSTMEQRASSLEMKSQRHSDSDPSVLVSPVKLDPTKIVISREGFGIGDSTKAPVCNARTSCWSRPKGLREAAAPAHGPSASRHLFNKGQNDELHVADIDERDEFDLSYPVQPQVRTGDPIKRRTLYLGDCIPPEEANRMHRLLWGLGCRPSSTWKQGFYFSRTNGLEFGLVQRQGGPCGVLAALQAYVIAQLHYNCESVTDSVISTDDQEDALLDSMAAVLQLVSKGGHVRIVQCLDVNMKHMSYQQLSHSCKVWPAYGTKDTKRKLAEQKGNFLDEDGWGIVMFLFSVILTKGIQNIKSEMDDGDLCLTGEHGYCSQELVNLLLTGTATTNVFDGEQDCGGRMLKGILSRPRIGLLTLLEWYRYVEVGNNLKTPELPIWVVCSESHFTVLFSVEKQIPDIEKGPFDLMYYDGLANQSAPIMLTISERLSRSMPVGTGSKWGDLETEDAIIPPLECVIRTKWKGCDVYWNGSEPLL